MSKLRIALVHEFDLLLRQRVGLLLALLTPLLVLLLLGRQSDPPPVRLLVAGAPHVAGLEPEIERLIMVLRESTGLEVLTKPETVTDPLARIAHGRFDLLLNYEKGNLSIYTAETDPLKLMRLEQIGAGILRASALIDARLAAQQPQEAAGFQPDAGNPGEDLVSPEPWRPLFDEVWWSQPALYEDLFMLGSFPVNPLFEYFPQAADPRVNTLPVVIAGILFLFPFLLMLARGREGALPIGVSSWRDAAAFVLGKSIVASGFTLVVFLLMLIVTESLFGVLIKAGIFRMMLLLLPALMAAAFLGLGLSRLARSPLSAASIGMAYVMVVVLLGGVVAPLTERSLLVQSLGWILPSTLVQPALSDWMFGARIDWTMLRPLGGLVLQGIFYGAFAAFTVLRLPPPPAAAGDPGVEKGAGHGLTSL